jgi:MFS family permease
MRALRTALGNTALRRLLVSYLAVSLGTWALAIVFALYAYAEGGATAVGIAVLVRMLPAGLAAPSLALLADRHSRRAVLVTSAAVQALALGAVALAVAVQAPFALVLALAAVFTVAGVASKPAQAALIPQLAGTPTEMAATNVAWSGTDYAGFLLGSAAAGALAASAGLAAGIAICALPFVAGAILLAGLPRDRRPDTPPGAVAAGGPAELTAGLRTVRAHADMRLITSLFAANCVVQGVIDVLLVVTAIELLGLGNSGVGWLNTAWGVGGVAGGFVALALLGHGRLASGVALGCVVSGLSFAAIGLVHEPAAALALLALMGVGLAVLESATLTLTQRLAAEDVLARVFGVQETIGILGVAAGGVLAAVLVSLLGLSAAIVAAGLVLPALAVLLRARLGRLEAGAVVPERAFALLRGLPMFAPLPVATIENLAVSAEERDVEAGTEIIRQGDVGTHLYVVDEGTLDVVADGRPLAQRVAGECVGEIALLHDMPRMATVRAVTAARLLVLDRRTFLAGVSAHARSSHAAEQLAVERLRASDPVAP